MAAVQYAFTTGNTSTYHFMVRYVDGVPSVDTTFPGAATPIILHKHVFSPDGKYLIAAGLTASTTPIRLWRLRDDGTFVEVALPAQAASRTINDIKFVTDTHILFACDVTGLWAGLLDRTANTIAWTFVNNNAFISLAVHPDKERVATSRRDNAGVHYVKRTGNSWAIITGSFQGNEVAKKFTAFNRDATQWFGVVTLNSAALIWRRVRDSDNYLNYGDGYDYTVQDTPPGNINTIDIGAMAWAPNGTRIIYSLNRGPRLGSQTISINPTTNLPSCKRNRDASSVSLPAIANHIVFRNNDTFLCAVNSPTQGTGRVREFKFNFELNDFTENPELSDLFDSRTGTPNWISVGPVFETGNNLVNLYNGSIKDIVDGNVNLTSLKAALVSSAGTFNPAHTTLAQVLGANEVYGSSWPQGGIDTDDATFEKFGTGADYALRVTIPSVNMSAAGTITFRSVVIYDNAHADKKPLGMIVFAEDQTAAQFDRLQFASTNGRFAIFSLEE